MDYLLNTYVFNYMPFEVSDDWRKYVTVKSVDLVRVSYHGMGFDVCH